MKKTLLIGATGLAMSMAAPAFAQNLVSNGSFETGSFGPWVPTNTSGTAPVVITYGNTNGYPTGAFGEAILPNTVASASPDAVGRYVAYFSSDTANPDSITQTITGLVAGRTYNLGFDYYAPQNGINNPFDATLSLLINGSTVSSVTAGGNQQPATPGQTWFNFSSTFTPVTSGPATLSFNFRGLGTTAADFAIDRVFVTAAVPEPATWSMLILGFGLVGGAMRRRRTSVRFANA